MKVKREGPKWSELNQLWKKALWWNYSRPILLHRSTHSLYFTHLAHSLTALTHSLESLTSLTQCTHVTHLVPRHSLNSIGASLVLLSLDPLFHWGNWGSLTGWNHWVTRLSDSLSEGLSEGGEGLTEVRVTQWVRVKEGALCTHSCRFLWLSSNDVSELFHSRQVCGTHSLKKKVKEKQLCEKSDPLKKVTHPLNVSSGTRTQVISHRMWVSQSLTQSPSRSIAHSRFLTHCFRRTSSTDWSLSACALKNRLHQLTIRGRPACQPALEEITADQWYSIDSLTHSLTHLVRENEHLRDSLTSPRELANQYPCPLTQSQSPQCDILTHSETSLTSLTFSFSLTSFSLTSSPHSFCVTFTVHRAMSPSEKVKVHPRSAEDHENVGVSPLEVITWL